MKTFISEISFSQLTKKEQHIMSLLGANYATRNIADDTIYLWRDAPMYIAHYGKFVYGKSPHIAVIDADLFPSLEKHQIVEKELSK